MTPYYQDDAVTLHHGDCLDVLATLPDASVDAVVTDPPYGLANTDPAHVAETITRWVNGERDYLPGGSGFMGKAWDAFVPPAAVWDECLRVLKPGGHVLTFAGSRTVDLMTLGLRLAGFEIRDSIAWIYSTGFPKSLDVSKAIDKAAQTTHQQDAISARARGDYAAERRALDALALAERAPSGDRGNTSCPYLDRGDACPGHGDAGQSMSGATVHRLPTAPATPDAEQWQGWGTALKPAFEPVVVARKPLTGTVAANVLEHGTGALNIDGCRVGRVDGDRTEYGRGNHLPHANTTASLGRFAEVTPYEPHTAGRWPTNVVLDDTQAAVLDEMSGETVSKAGGSSGTHFSAGDPGVPTPDRPRGGHDDSGGASRFFPTFRYEAKAPASERPKVNGTAHPTVKPLDLMRWLVRLVTPPGGTVLEPFAGSGTTVEACVVEGFKCIAIEKTDEYLPLTVARIHRRRDPVAAIKLAGDDLGLFDLEDTP